MLDLCGVATGLASFIAASVLLALVLAYALADAVPSLPIRGINAIVTGGSEGLGFAIAVELVSEGADVVIISRNRHNLESAVSRLLRIAVPGRQHVGGVAADLTSAEETARAVTESVAWLKDQQVGKRWRGIQLLVNNVGNALPGCFEGLDPQTHEIMFRTNYMTHVHMTHACLPHLLEGAPSRVIGISSMASEAPLYGYSSYAPAKLAIRALYDILHQEVSQRGVHFSVAFPGSIATPALIREEGAKPPITRAIEGPVSSARSPREVAQKIVDSMRCWNFHVATHGAESFALRAITGGTSPASLIELWAQIALGGVLRVIGISLVQRRIARRVRREAATVPSHGWRSHQPIRPQPED